MSKAFTKEDDEGGFEPPSPSARWPAGPFRLTATGAKKLEASKEAAIVDALARAERLAPVGARPERAALGVTVRVRGEGGEREYRLVSAEERALLGEGCSVASPIGRALLGAEVGEARELVTPRGVEEVEIVALLGEQIAQTD